MTEKGNRRGLSKGIVILPSLLTAAALFSGFYAIIFTFQSLLLNQNDFRPAVWAILLATLFDSLDGRMARLMKAESEFGFQFDSIADMVSFGVAPSVLVYGIALVHLDRLGWLGAFMFLACAAIRLARFNSMSAESSSRKYFKGLASPIAAGGLAVCAYILKDIIPDALYAVSIFIVTTLLALLMISNIRFRSFKDLNFKRYPMQIFFILILCTILVITFIEKALVIIFLVYLGSGIVEEVVIFRRRRRSDPKSRFLPFGDRSP